MKIVISGVAGPAEEVFATRSDRFFEFHIKSRRYSGTYDTIPVVVPEELVPKEGSIIIAKGTIRSIDRDGHLIIYVFSRDIEPYTDNLDVNECEGECFLVKRNPLRTTPSSNRKIVDCILAVNYPRRSAYIPALAWYQCADQVSHLDIGSEMTVYGRLQSREYTKALQDGTFEVKTTYELSISDIFGKGEN